MHNWAGTPQRQKVLNQYDQKAKPTRSFTTRRYVAHLLVLVCMCLGVVLGSLPGLFSPRAPEKKPAQQATVSKAATVQPTEKPMGWKEVAQKFNELEKVKRETLAMITKKTQARTPTNSTRTKDKGTLPTPKDEYKVRVE
jgi:hypothetical protein